MCGQKLDRWTEEREDLKIKIKKNKINLGT
jgi:hypothetical protein